jgi:hypothetical protein
MEVLIAEDRLEEAALPKLKAYLKEKSHPVSGTKAELVLRVKQAAGSAVAPEEEDAVQQQIQEKADTKLAKQAQADLWLSSFVVPESALVHSVHSPFACPGYSFGWPGIGNGVGSGGSALTRDVTGAVGTDFAVGFSSATRGAKCVFYMPKKKKVLAVVHAWTHATVREMEAAWRGSGELSGVLNLKQYGWGAAPVTKKQAGVVALRQTMWVQVCQPWLQREYPNCTIRSDVCVLQREPGWTDAEEDFDSHFGKRNFYDKPKKGWGFTVPEEVYRAAWVALFEFMGSPAGEGSFAEAPAAISQAELKKMKVADLRALCEERKLVKSTAKRVLKADLLSLLMQSA